MSTAQCLKACVLFHYYNLRIMLLISWLKLKLVMKLCNDGGGHFWHFLRPEVPARWSCHYTCELPVFFLFLTLYLPISNRGQHYAFNVNPALLIMHRLMKETLPISIYVRPYNNLIDNSNICQGTIQRIMAMIDSRVTENCLVDVICK